MLIALKTNLPVHTPLGFWLPLPALAPGRSPRRPTNISNRTNREPELLSAGAGCAVEIRQSAMPAHLDFDDFPVTLNVDNLAPRFSGG